MYIRNKSGLIQECYNEDVIRACKKDTEHFTVADNRESLTAKEAVNKPEERPELEKMKVDELRAMAKERGIEGAASLNKEELLAVLKG